MTTVRSPRGEPRLCPTTEDKIAETAAELAREARAARSPGRSLGALIRWRCREQGWPDQVCSRLLELGLEQLGTPVDDGDASDPPLEPSPIAGRWLTVEEASALTNRSPATIKRRLHTREGRRDYGWPWWDGHRWQIPSPAVDPTMRAGYMATLPEEEPYAPPAFAES